MRTPENFSKSGFFWLPSNPDQKLPGTLKLLESGDAELQILGVFGDRLTAMNDILRDRNAQGHPNIERITGILEDGKSVTLDKCFYRHRNINFAGVSKSIIYIHFVFVGAQYHDGVEITFSKFTFSLEGLDEWLSISGLTVEHDLHMRGGSITFQPPQEIAIKLAEDIDMMFTFGWTLPFFSSITEAKVTQKAYISLRSEQ